MSIKSRLEKLEEALPEKDSGLRILLKSIVRRDGNGLLWKKPFYAVLVRPAPHANETLQRHESETQTVFLDRVRDAIRRISPAEAEAFRWEPQPGTDRSE